MKLTEIDLSKTTRKGGGGLEVGKTYLVLYNGRYGLTTFSEVWFGLTCSAFGQYDPPGINNSRWQKIWLFDDEGLASSLEHSHAESMRKQLAASGCTLFRIPITEETPIEAFHYRPDYSRVPRYEDDDDFF